MFSPAANPLHTRSLSCNALARMENSEQCSEIDAFRALFGRLWWEKAARALNISIPHAFNLAAGRKRMTRRHWRILETYMDQRWRARTQRQARELASFQRKQREAAQAEEQAAMQLRTTMVKLKREGKL